MSRSDVNYTLLAEAQGLLVRARRAALEAENVLESCEEELARAICKAAASGMPKEHIAARTGYSRATIYRILLRAK